MLVLVLMPRLVRAGEGPVSEIKAVRGAVRALQRAAQLAPRTAEACQIRGSHCSALQRLSEVRGQLRGN
jgi:hypothetical protein